MYKRDGYVFRPRTREEDQEILWHCLHAPLITADYVSSISQVLSPRRPVELRDLARIIRDTAEPQVKTGIPHDLGVRVEHDADLYPNIQAGLKVELMYAYALLHATDQTQTAEQRVAYLQEAARLEKEVCEDRNSKKLYVHADVTHPLRGASMNYCRAAWNFLNKGDEAVTKRLLTGVLQQYSYLRKITSFYQSNESKKIAQQMRESGIEAIPKMAAAFLHLGQEMFSKQGIQIDKWSAEELVTLLIVDNFPTLHQDVLLGEMRCYALQGNYKMLTKTKKELDVFYQANEYPSASIIKAAAESMMDEAKKNIRWWGLKRWGLRPFVPDSPPLVLEAVASALNRFGKAPPRLWTPGERISRIPEIL